MFGMCTATGATTPIAVVKAARPDALAHSIDWVYREKEGGEQLALTCTACPAQPGSVAD